MPSSDWTNDDALLDALREAVRESGEVSEAVLAAGRGAFAWRDVDADLALLQLAHDSLLVNTDGAVALRAADDDGAARMLVFQGRGCTVEIEVGERGIVGQLIPPGEGQVDLLTGEGHVEAVTTDEVGCFTFSPPLQGPVRLRCSIGDVSFITEWIVV